MKLGFFWTLALSVFISSSEFTTDPSICYSDQQLWVSTFLPETMENKWMWLAEWQKSNSQLQSYTSLKNYSIPKNVLAVPP